MMGFINGALGDHTMDMSIKEFISKRCEEALIENREYATLERGEADVDETQALAEELCYQKGFIDAVAIIIRCLI
ncbi:MAG: hypothetical protein GX321_09230 [Clostridiales bacterium]|nr:hypothetical protein [Clostridiales bacterium]